CCGTGNGRIQETDVANGSIDRGTDARLDCKINRIPSLYGEGRDCLVGAGKIIGRQADGVQLCAITQDLGDGAETGQILLGEMPVDGDGSADFADPPADDPMLERVGSATRIDAGAADGL